ncbi:hypothetical protein R6Q59_006777 [Mikania micrantha]
MVKMVPASRDLTTRPKEEATGRRMQPEGGGDWVEAVTGKRRPEVADGDGRRGGDREEAATEKRRPEVADGDRRRRRPGGEDGD